MLIIIEYRESIAESNNNNASKINFYPQKGKKSLTEREKNCDFVYFMGGGLEKKKASPAF